MAGRLALSAELTRVAYAIGDVVFWATASTAGEYTFIGHPKGDKTGKVLVLAIGAEIGFEVDADECNPTGRSNPQRGREYASGISAIIRASSRATRDTAAGPLLEVRRSGAPGDRAHR